MKKKTFTLIDFLGSAILLTAGLVIFYLFLFHGNGNFIAHVSLKN